MAGAERGRAGLTALGMGTRYSGVKVFDKDGDLTWVPFHKMDTPLMFAVLVLIAVLGMFVYEVTLAIERWLLLPYTKVS